MTSSGAGGGIDLGGGEVGVSQDPLHVSEGQVRVANQLAALCRRSCNVQFAPSIRLTRLNVIRADVIC